LGFFVAPVKFIRREDHRGRRTVMTPNPAQVIVTNEDLARASVHGFAARHRDFPDVHCTGDSATDAAARLAGLLYQTLDTAPSDWRREMILVAIEDVRAFAEGARG
jgi:hypothetical protein